MIELAAVVVLVFLAWGVLALALVLLKALLWLLLLLATFTVMNPPQCPADYNQEQVNQSGCNVGANIGLGLFFVFIVIPLGLVVAGLWLAYFNKSRLKKQAQEIEKKF